MNIKKKKGNVEFYVITFIIVLGLISIGTALVKSKKLCDYSTEALTVELEKRKKKLKKDLETLKEEK